MIRPSQQSRVTDILEIPKLAPYLFIEPDYGSRETELMVKPIPQVRIGTVQFTCSGFFLLILMARFSENLDCRRLTTGVGRLFVGGRTDYEAMGDLGVSQKFFMTVLRHALSGMKV